MCANVKYKLEVKNIYGVDNNKYLIALLKKFQKDGVEYFSVTKEKYIQIKENKNNYDDWYVGYVGFLQSFGSKFFDGYIKNNIDGRNIINERYRNLLKQVNNLKNVKLFYKDIFNINYSKLPRNSLLYFDPPYSNTEKYYSNFDSNKFWKLVNKLSKDFIVLVSEFNALKDFVSIWSKEKVSTLNSKGNYKKDMEHLFIHKCNLDKI